MEKKTIEEVIKDLRVLNIGELPFFPFHKPDDMDNETYQQEILRAQEEQAAYFTRYEEAQVEILNDYVKQETERLQAENQKMREILSEIMNGMSAHLDYQDLMDEELTAEERATRANYDDFITQISTLLNQ